MDDQNLITTRELCSVTGLKEHKVWRLVKKGRLQPLRVPGQRLFLWDIIQVTKARRIAAEIRAKKAAKNAG